MLSVHDNEQYFFEALKAGASGYVLKSEANRDLIEACRARCEGSRSSTQPRPRRWSRTTSSARSAAERRPSDPLTPRELEVIKLIAEGLTSEEVAEALDRSAKKTVDRHRDNILEKLGMRNRVELTRYAIKRGLVEP